MMEVLVMELLDMCVLSVKKRNILKKEKKKMNITILSVDVKTVPTQKGSYQSAEVAYKNNTFQGKVEGKKVMSFGATAGAFKTLTQAQSGETYEVEVVKNAAGYNDWTSLTPAGLSTASPASSGAVSAATSNKAPQGATPVRSTYETPEERAAKQVYIIKQSSLSAAVSTLSVGAKVLKPDDVIALATKYVNFVMGVKDKGASGFEDIPDFADEEFPSPN